MTDHAETLLRKSLDEIDSYRWRWVITFWITAALPRLPDRVRDWRGTRHREGDYPARDSRLGDDGVRWGLSACAAHLPDDTQDSAGDRVGNQGVTTSPLCGSDGVSP